MKKKLLIIAAVVVAAIGITLGVVAANLGKIVNSRKGELLAQAKTLTGREVAIGDVGVSLWPGIGVRISDVSIGDDPAFSQDAFVRAKDLRVNVKLLPLFKKQVVIKRLVLSEPSITVIKGDANRFNFTSLMERLAPPSKGGGARPASSAAAVVAFADIKDGSVHYVDRVRGLDQTVAHIDFAAKDVSLDSEVRATLAAAVFHDAQDVHLDVTVGPVGESTPENLAKAPIALKFELARVTFADLAKFAPKKGASAAPPPGDVEASGTLSGTLGAAVLDELRARAAVLGATEPNVELTASGGPFDLLADSTLVFAKARLKGTLTAPSIPLAGFKVPQKDPAVPAPQFGGELSASASFEGPFAALGFTGEIDATAATITQKPQFEKAAGVTAKATVKGTFHTEGRPDDGVDFSSVDIVLHALKATGTGRWVPFKGRESFDFTFKGQSAIAPWKDLMPTLAPFAPSGDASVAARIRGVPKPGGVPDVTGTATFANVGATLPQIPEKLHDGKGTATFGAKTAGVSGATFKIGKSAFRIDADATALKPLAATYVLTSPEVWRADVQAASPNAPKLPRPEVFRDVSARGRMTEKTPKVVENEIALASKSGVVSNIDYTNFTADVRATPETVFIDRFSAQSMGGTVSGKGTFEPKPSKFNLTTKVEQVNLAEYFHYKAPALADVLVGRIDADFTLSGAGKTWEELQKTLVGSGGALVIEGALLNMNVMQQIVTMMQGIPMVPAGFADQMKAKNPKAFSENKTAFQNLKGKVNIADGKIQAPELKLVTPDFVIDGAGWFSFGKEMDVNSTLTLSEKMTRDIVAQVPAAKYILSPAGRIEVPLSLSGALAKPRIGVDTATLTARAQQAFLKEGQQKLDQQLKSGVKDLIGGMGKKKEPPKAPADTSKVRPR